jgi:cytochrome c2
MWTALRENPFTLRMRMPRKRRGGTTARITRAASYAAVPALALACLFLAGCDANSESGPVNFSGDSRRGMELIKQHGCGGCHLIPGIADATGNVGPPLLHVGTRSYIAGFFSNSPENMALWLQDPQRALPGNAMPRMGITPQESRDITAFLYTLK